MLAPIATARIHQRFRIRILLRLCRLLESVSPLWVSVLGCAKLLQSLFLEWQPVFDSGALSARRCHLLPKRRRRETGGGRSGHRCRNVPITLKRLSYHWTNVYSMSHWLALPALRALFSAIPSTTLHPALRSISDFPSFILGLPVSGLLRVDFQRAGFVPQFFHLIDAVAFGNRFTHGVISDEGGWLLLAHRVPPAISARSAKFAARRSASGKVVAVCGWK